MVKEIIEITQPLMSYEGLENRATLYDDGTLSIKLYEAMKGLFE